MAVQRITQKRIPRRWCIYGPAGSGKSTLIPALLQPVLVIDADQRIAEIVNQMADVPNLYSFSENPEDHTDIERICELIKTEVNECDARSIVVDSLTTLINPIIQKALLEAKDPDTKNRSSPYVRKSALLKMLQDTLTQTGRDIFYIWHKERGNFNGQDEWKHTVSEYERERLRRSSNAMLETFVEGGKFGIRIDWSRAGLQDVTFRDKEGFWEGIPEQIDAALAAEAPRFPNRRKAIEWGVKQGRFASFEESQSRYLEIKEKFSPKTASEMFRRWEQEVTGDTVSSST